MQEHAPRAMAEDFAVGQSAIDRRAHRAEVALADFRVDRRAGQFPVGKFDAGCFRRHQHDIYVPRSQTAGTQRSKHRRKAGSAGARDPAGKHTSEFK